MEQDYLRRVVLRERESSEGIASQLIEQTVRFALANEYDVVLEGILARSRYAETITSLLAAHRGASFVFYLEVSYEETLRRHAARPQAADFGPDEMSSWYLPHDELGITGERVIPEGSDLRTSVDLIARIAGFTERTEDATSHTRARR